MSHEEMALKIFNNKYICIFCDERKSAETSHIASGNIGICRECYDKLGKTALSIPYPGTRDISYIMSPFEYTGSMRQAILDFKFKGNIAYAPLFAGMSEEYLNSYPIWDSFDYIIPVPLHISRLKERGYNQSELIASHISDFIGVPMRTDILQRIRATQKQSGLKRHDRILNVRDAFKCDTDLHGKSVIIFDDICTTGSTLQSCAAELKKSGAGAVCALTLAIYASEKIPLITY